MRYGGQLSHNLRCLKSSSATFAEKTPPLLSVPLSTRWPRHRPITTDSTVSVLHTGVLSQLPLPDSLSDLHCPPNFCTTSVFKAPSPPYQPSHSPADIFHDCRQHICCCFPVFTAVSSTSVFSTPFFSLLYFCLLFQSVPSSPDLSSWLLACFSISVSSSPVHSAGLLSSCLHSFCFLILFLSSLFASSQPCLTLLSRIFCFFRLRYFTASLLTCSVLSFLLTGPALLIALPLLHPQHPSG